MVQAHVLDAVDEEFVLRVVVESGVQAGVDHQHAQPEQQLARPRRGHRRAPRAAPVQPYCDREYDNHDHRWLPRDPPAQKIEQHVQGITCRMRSPAIRKPLHSSPPCRHNLASIASPPREEGRGGGIQRSAPTVDCHPRATPANRSPAPRRQTPRSADACNLVSTREYRTAVLLPAGCQRVRYSIRNSARLMAMAIAIGNSETRSAAIRFHVAPGAGVRACSGTAETANMFAWLLRRSECGGCGMRIPSPVFVRNPRCAASSAIRRSGSSPLNGAQKNALCLLRSSTLGLVRPTHATGSRSVLRRHAHLPRTRGSTRAVSKLRQGEARVARFSG